MSASKDVFEHLRIVLLLGGHPMLAADGAMARRLVAGDRSASEWCCGRYRFDETGRVVQFDGKRIRLDPLEFALASYLFRHPDHLHPRHELFNVVWSGPMASGNRTVDIHVARVRRKLQLGPDGDFDLRCVRNMGYRLVDLSRDAAPRPPRANTP